MVSVAIFIGRCLEEIPSGIYGQPLYVSTGLNRHKGFRRIQPFINAGFGRQQPV